MIYRFFTVTIGTIALLVSSLPAQASISEPAPACQVRGIIKSVKDREEQGHGISEGRTYHYVDVEILNTNKTFTSSRDRAAYKNVNSSEFNCELDNGKVTTYQLSTGENRKLIEVFIGECIVASSHMFADGNFRSGNWISGIAKIDRSDCERR